MAINRRGFMDCARRCVKAIERLPCLKAFFDVVFLPSVVRGPVDFFQGFHFFIAAAWRARRSSFHPEERRGAYFRFFGVFGFVGVFRGVRVFL